MQLVFWGESSNIWDLSVKIVAHLLNKFLMIVCKNLSVRQALSPVLKAKDIIDFLYNNTLLSTIVT